MAENKALVINLSFEEMAELRDELTWALNQSDTAAVWIDPIDQAFKIKFSNYSWSRPMGVVEEM